MSQGHWFGLHPHGRVLASLSAGRETFVLCLPRGSLRQRSKEPWPLPHPTSASARAVPPPIPAPGKRA